MKQILCASTLQIWVLEFKTYFNLRNCCETGPGNDGLFAEIQTRSHTYHTKLSRMCFRILILLNCNFTHLRCLMILWLYGNKLLIIYSLTLSAPNFRRHLSSVFFFFLIFTNYCLERRLCVRLKDWISNSVDPDETANRAVSSGSMLFVKTYYYRLGQWKS